MYIFDRFWQLAVFLDILKTTRLDAGSSFSIRTGGLLLSKLTFGWTVLLTIFDIYPRRLISHACFYTASLQGRVKLNYMFYRSLNFFSSSIELRILVLESSAKISVLTVGHLGQIRTLILIYFLVFIVRF